MKPQKVILYTEDGADEDRPALLIDCPICGTKAGVWCGLIDTAIPRGLYFVHSLRARRGAGEARRRIPHSGGD